METKEKVSLSTKLKDIFKLAGAGLYLIVAMPIIVALLFFGGFLILLFYYLIRAMVGI